MAPPGCLSRCRPRGSVHRRGRARHLPPPPRRPSRGPGSPSVARRCAREDDRGSGRPAGAETRPDHRARSADPAGRPRRRRRDDRSRHRRRRRRTSPAAGRTRGERARAPERPGARPLEFLRCARGRWARERDFAGRRKARSPVREGPEEPPPPGPEGGLATRSLAGRHRPPTSATAGRPAVARRAKERGRGPARLREGPCRAPLPPGTRAALAHREERAGLGRPRAHRRPAFGGAGRGGRRLGAGRPATLRRGRTGGRPAQAGGGRGGKQPRRRRRARRASRPGRDARCSAGRAPPARTVPGTRDASPRRAAPSPRPRPRPGLGGAARLHLLLSGAAARGARRARPTSRRAVGKGVWPPGPTEAGGRGPSERNGAGVRGRRARATGRTARQTRRAPAPNR